LTEVSVFRAGQALGHDLAEAAAISGHDLIIATLFNGIEVVSPKLYQLGCGTREQRSPGQCGGELSISQRCPIGSFEFSCSLLVNCDLFGKYGLTLSNQRFHCFFMR
jgi:hypothetical protein